MRKGLSKKRHWRLPPLARRIVCIAFGSIVGIFIILNAVLWVVYRERTYPRTRVMDAALGNTPYASLSQKVSEQQLLPETLTFTYSGKKTTVKLQDLGISKDVERTVKSAGQQRAWLPLANMFASPRLDAPIATERGKLTAKIEELATIFRQDPVNARLTLTDASVGIAEGRDGYALNQEKLPELITETLDAGKTALTVPATRLTPKIQAADLQDDKKTLEGQLNTAITYHYNGKDKRASVPEIASWYVASGEGYVVSRDNVLSYITQIGSGFGIRVKDAAQAAAATEQALASQKAATITLTAQLVAKTYTYCTDLKDVDASHLSGLKAKLKATFADPRGWSLNGLVEYKEVASGCDFTVWLTAAELMPTFGAICEPMWSCRVGRNVVLNFTRWQNASPAWNAAGGALEEYRNMLINHETGHWLGFGHRHCSGAGQPAPVMQQQSIDLQGCTFNAWPVAAELATLKQNLGI